MNITQDERLAFAVSLEKRIKEVSEELKADARDKLRNDFEETYNDRHVIVVNGQRAGTVSIPKGKIIPRAKAENLSEYYEFLDENNLLTKSPVRGWESQFEQVGDKTIYKPTGEEVDFLDWGDTEGKETPTVRVTMPFEEVLEVLQPKLEGTSPLHLLGGEDGSA